MSSTLTLQLASPPDREHLVAEIWLGNNQVAEISQESSEPVLEIYPNPEGGAWLLPLASFVAAVQQATQHLLGGGSTH